MILKWRLGQISDTETLEQLRTEITLGETAGGPMVKNKN